MEGTLILLLLLPLLGAGVLWNSPIFGEKYEGCADEVGGH